MTLRVSRRVPDLADLHAKDASRQHGLPEKLPEGEQILWQGKPNSWALARESLFVYWILGYTAIIAAWRVGTLIDLVPIWAAFSAAVPILLTGLAAVGLFWLLAYAQARATVYTITNKRVVMQIGAALSMSLNLPFTKISSAQMDLRKSGTGTIALKMAGKTRLAYLVCWPHVRPWRWNPAQPALRCIPDADAVAQILSEAVGTTTTSDAATAPSPVPAMIPAE